MPPVLPPPGRRILVIGTSGSGKTYVAEALARILDIPYICNDAIIWRADWQETPKDVVLAEFDAATAVPAWTLDGNLAGSHPEDKLVLSRCDTIVWLDLPRWQIWSAISQRTFWRVITRKPMWHGNVERWRTIFSRDSMIWWSIRTFSRRRRNYTALFASRDLAGKTLIASGPAARSTPGSLRWRNSRPFAAGNLSSSYAGPATHPVAPGRPGNDPPRLQQ